MGRAYLLVEGHGEVEAAGNLVSRLCVDRGLALRWAAPMRWKNLHTRSGVEKGANYVRTKDDATGLLVLRDEDDGCPKSRGPEMASWLRALCLPFPSAVVLLCPEYEVLFLPGIESMAGQPLRGPVGDRPGLVAGVKWVGDWESRRGVKEWLSAQFPPRVAYKPTVDQLPLTRMIDFTTLRNAGVPCFGTLERALGFLAGPISAGETYPGA